MLQNLNLTKGQTTKLFSNKLILLIMERESGYYWVNTSKDYWSIMFYNEQYGLWYLVGSEFPDNGKKFKGIDERKIERIP